jgi:peptidoglycan/xylan/chitin deacetylase (PgdA/CDA1 family)
MKFDYNIQVTMGKKILKLAKNQSPKIKSQMGKIRLPIPLIFTLFILSMYFVGTNLPVKRVHSQEVLEASTIKYFSPIEESTFSAKVATTEATPTPAPTLVPVAAIPVNSGNAVHVPIIYYHYIGKNPNPADKLRDHLSIDPELFDEQMAYLKSAGYNPIDFDTLYAALKDQATLPPKPIILTFDDGYIDFYVNAFPILRKYNLHATEFIPTGLVDTAYYLHWDQIKEMDQTGLISFQAHSVTHVSLPTLSGEDLRGQLVASKNKLEAELGKPVNFMAYPYGTSNANTWAAVRAAGYFGATGTWGGRTESEGDLYDMPRNNIPGGTTMEKFEQLVAE